MIIYYYSTFFFWLKSNLNKITKCLNSTKYNVQHNDNKSLKKSSLPRHFKKEETKILRRKKKP